MYSKHQKLDMQIADITNLVLTLNYKIANKIKPCDRNQSDWIQYNQEKLFELNGLIRQRMK